MNTPVVLSCLWQEKNQMKKYKQESIMYFVADSGFTETFDFLFLSIQGLYIIFFIPHPFPSFRTTSLNMIVDPSGIVS